MKTVLIGYEIKSGSFKADDGKEVEYSNRVVTFITDSGADEKNVGFKPYSESFKLAELAQILHVNKSDQLVNDALNCLVNKPVWVAFAPVGGNLKVKGFGLEQSK